MILASKVIKHYKGLAKVPLEAVEEDYDDKPLPPVPPHQAPGAVLGARYGRGAGGHGSLRNMSCPLNLGSQFVFTSSDCVIYIISQGKFVVQVQVRNLN